MIGVFCLEGNWRPDDLSLEDSLEPVLQLLERHRVISYIRRDIATRPELEHYLGLWSNQRYWGYEFCYLAFHGDGEKALLLDEPQGLSFATLGHLLCKHRAGRDAIIHLASCYGLKVSDRRLESFLADTGALAVSGYASNVDTIEAAAFELLMFQSLSGPWSNIERRYQLIESQYGELCDRLQFRWLA